MVQEVGKARAGPVRLWVHLGQCTSSVGVSQMPADTRSNLFTHRRKASEHRTFLQQSEAKEPQKLSPAAKIKKYGCTPPILRPTKKHEKKGLPRQLGRQLGHYPQSSLSCSHSARIARAPDRWALKQGSCAGSWTHIPPHTPHIPPRYPPHTPPHSPPHALTMASTASCGIQTLA